MKFIVITLLFLISFSGCIGDNDASGNKTATTVSPPSDGKPVEPVEPSGSTNVITSDIPNPPDTTVPSNITTPTTPATTTPTTTVKPENTTTATTPTTTTPSTTTVKPENTTTATTPTTSPTTSSTTQNPAPDTTVTPPTNVTTTVTPPVTTTKAPAPTPIICRRFDGPSFIGGIVLAVGLMAISVVAYKFYKARTDRNYHTL